MRQFDVCRLRGRNGLVVVLQHDRTDELATRLVAPVVETTGPDIAMLRVALAVEGRPHVVQVDRMAAIRRSDMGEVITNVRHVEDPLKRAIDLLFLGF
jgi:mRNA-degrading endonuclease toxin of MazEF toxin-antitoxin module